MIKEFTEPPKCFLPITIGIRTRYTKAPVIHPNLDLVHRKTGQVFTADRVVVFPYLAEHDSIVFTKVYKIPRALVKSLSIPGHLLFHYLLDTIKVNKNYVSIRPAYFLDQMGYSKKSVNVYYKAIRELVDGNVIAKKADEKDVYWINSNMFYNGDRNKIKCDEQENRVEYIKEHS